MQSPHFVLQSHRRIFSFWNRNSLLVLLLLPAFLVTISNQQITSSKMPELLQHDNRSATSLNSTQPFERAALRAARPQAGCCGGDNASDSPHLLGGTYYTVNDEFSAKILLNNKGPIPIDVQPTLFRLDGGRFNVPTVSVGANTHRFVDLREWVALAGPQFKEGSIQLFHRGKDLVLGTQIYLTDDVHSLSFDEKLTELGSGGQRLEGVWWLPSPRGTVKLVVSNTTEAAVCAIVKVEGERPRKSAESTIQLEPHETKLLDVGSVVLSREHGAMSQYGAVSVEHGGTPGAILARAMASEAAKGYSLSIQFSNPAASKSTNLQGTGLRIASAAGESLAAKVVVHNASQIGQTLTGSVPITFSDGSNAIAQLPGLQLSAAETRLIDVSDVLRSQGVPLDQVASAGLELQHTGELGSLITSAFSVSESSNQVFRMPIWDVAAQRSATGGYPWYIDGGSSTVVFIKNTTDQPRQFWLYVMYTGGGYLYPLTTAPPHQTRLVDIRRLRDDQIPDLNGNTIPLSISRGQIEWSMTGGKDRVMIGRSEQVDFSKGVSSNYACMNCCGNSFYDAWIEPPEGSGFEGDEIQFRAMQQDANCYGQPFLPHPVGVAFSSFIASICQPDNDGFTTLIGPGQTSLGTSWSADSWISWGGPHHECEYSPVDVFRDGLCSVLGLDVTFQRAFLLDSSRTADFDGFNKANLNIDTCGGDRFAIKATFLLPQFSRSCCSNPSTSFVILPADNKFEFAPSPIDGTIYDFFGADSPPYVIIYLRRKADGTGSKNSVRIRVGGEYQDGSSYSGQGTVGLICQ